MKTILLLLLLISASAAQICPFETFNDITYFTIPVMTVSLTEWAGRKLKIEKRNRIILNVFAGALTLIGQRIYYDTKGEDHIIRELSTGVGISGCLFVYWKF